MKHDESQSHGGHHITPIITLAKTFALLLVLMVLTVGASYVDVGYPLINNLIALGIAITKALLVVFIFMGVWFGTGLTKLWAAAGFVWVLLMGIMFADYMTRSWEPVYGWDPAGDTPMLGTGILPPADLPTPMEEAEQRGMPPFPEGFESGPPRS
jgi:cytochrome c oxidase subunit IV